MVTEVLRLAKIEIMLAVAEAEGAVPLVVIVADVVPRAIATNAKSWSFTPELLKGVAMLAPLQIVDLNQNLMNI